MELEAAGESAQLLKFKPHEPGVYLLNIKFGDEHVVGEWWAVGGEWWVVGGWWWVVGGWW